MSKIEVGQKVWVLCTDAHFPKSGQYEVDLVNDVAFSVSGLNFIFNRVNLTCIERFSISYVFTDPVEYQRAYHIYALGEIVKGKWVGQRWVTYTDILNQMSNSELDQLFTIHKKAADANN